MSDVSEEETWQQDWLVSAYPILFASRVVFTEVGFAYFCTYTCDREMFDNMNIQDISESIKG